MTDLRFRGFWLALGWLMVAATLALSLMPHPPQVLRFDHADKLEHAVTFAGLMLWFGQLVVAAGRPRAAALLLGLGIAIEILQSFTPTRQFEFADMGADAVGIVFGWVLLGTPLGRLLGGIEQILLSKVSGK